MRKSISDSITTTVKDLNKSGLVDDITMKNIEKLCLPKAGITMPSTRMGTPLRSVPTGEGHVNRQKIKIFPSIIKLP